MAIRLTESGRKLNDADLLEVERRYQIQLPADYKSFLLQFNGGSPDKPLFRIKGKRAYGECVHYFLSMSDDPDISFHKYYERYKGENNRVPKDIIPVAFDPGGNLICLSVGSKNFGKVYFWDHESETSDRNLRGEDLRLISDSFQEFTDG